jgi:hypothetical protein
MTNLEALSGLDDKDDYEVNLVRDSFFEKLLVKALRDQSSTNKYSVECKSAIIDTVGEFLPCFIILGFDYNGTAVEIVKSKTDQEKESLGMRLQKFVPSFLNRQFIMDEDSP